MLALLAWLDAALGTTARAAAAAGDPLPSPGSPLLTWGLAKGVAKGGYGTLNTPPPKSTFPSHNPRARDRSARQGAGVRAACDALVDCKPMLYCTAASAKLPHVHNLFARRSEAWAAAKRASQSRGRASVKPLRSRRSRRSRASRKVPRRSMPRRHPRARPLIVSPP